MKNERRMDWKASNYLLILSFLSFSSIHIISKHLVFQSSGKFSSVEIC